jgi:DNA-directed RNA polymerase subunit RPC12/RpoP
MKIYCPHCSEVSEVTFVPLQGQNIVCPYCDQKFAYSVSMSLSRSVNKPDGLSRSFSLNRKSLANSSSHVDPTIVNKSTNNLIDCPDCGNKVSVRANSCPNCGAPIGNSAKMESPQEKYYAWNNQEWLNKSEKNRLSYLLFAFSLGWIGVHNFYRGCIKKGVMRIVEFIGGIIFDGIWEATDMVIWFGISRALLISFIIFLIIDICSLKDADGKRMYIDR